MSYFECRTISSLLYTKGEAFTGRSGGYEGLDAADIESLQRPPPPHHYSALDVHTGGRGFDQNGYLVVVGDPEYNGRPQVCTKTRNWCDVIQF